MEYGQSFILNSLLKVFEPAWDSFIKSYAFPVNYYLMVPQQEHLRLKETQDPDNPYTDLSITNIYDEEIDDSQAESTEVSKAKFYKVKIYTYWTEKSTNLDLKELGLQEKRDIYVLIHLDSWREQVLKEGITDPVMPRIGDFIEVWPFEEMFESQKNLDTKDYASLGKEESENQEIEKKPKFTFGDVPFGTRRRFYKVLDISRPFETLLNPPKILVLGANYQRRISIENLSLLNS